MAWTERLSCTTECSSATQSRAPTVRWYGSTPVCDCAIADRQTDGITFRPPCATKVHPVSAVAVWFLSATPTLNRRLPCVQICTRMVEEHERALPCPRVSMFTVRRSLARFTRTRAEYSCRVRLRLNTIVKVVCSRVATAAVWSVPCLKRVPHSPHCKYIAWSAQQYSRVSTVGAQWFGRFRDLPLRL